MSDHRRHERVLSKARQLYRAMPGAPVVQCDDRGELWGVVVDNEHYKFCVMLAQMIDEVDTRVHVEAD